VVALMWGAVALTQRPAAVSLGSIRTVLDSTAGTRMMSDAVVSPDSRQVTFTAQDEDTGRTRLWVRVLSSGEARALTGTDGASRPFWSPRSDAIGFFANGRLKIAGLEGANVRTLADVGLNPAGGSWSRNGGILFARFRSGLTLVSDHGDQSEPVTTLEVNAYQQPKNGPDVQPLKDAKGQPVMEDVKAATQSIAMGPVASQEAIKMLGTNGGGFFNANSAHPFENPTPLSNFVQMLSIFLIPAGLVFCFGRMVGDMRQGLALLATMALIFVVMVVIAAPQEQAGNPLLTPLGVDQTTSALQPGGNMEGKEARFGIAASTLFAAITTAASCGAVNSMHDSFMPLGGAVPLVLIQLGEVVFGGAGSGLYGMLVCAVLADFIAGLMIGRTPEYLGKKIESYDMKMVSIAILATPILVLAGTAIAVGMNAGKAGVANPGAHGFSEILYAFSSAANNNGSAFAGLSANTPFYNVALAIAMWFGRFAVIVPVLALAGSLAGKKRLAATPGTLPTHGPMFVLLLIGTVVLVGLLNYVPALALGPVAEHFLLGAIR